MQFIRSLVFSILFYSAIVFVFILALPTLVFPNKATLICGKILANIIIFLLRYIMGCKVFFSGLDNLQKNEKFFQDLNY